MYEVRFRGHWGGAVERALAGFEITEDGRHTVVTVADASALAALVNCALELGLMIEQVMRVGDTMPDRFE